MAGSDPDLREAVSNASNMDATKRVIDGVETYCYDISGVTIRHGRPGS
jgi:hypothetical protein